MIIILTLKGKYRRHWYSWRQNSRPRSLILDPIIFVNNQINFYFI